MIIYTMVEYSDHRLVEYIIPYMMKEWSSVIWWELAYDDYHKVLLINWDNFTDFQFWYNFWNRYVLWRDLLSFFISHHQVFRMPFWIIWCKWPCGLNIGLWKIGYNIYIIGEREWGSVYDLFDAGCVLDQYVKSSTLSEYTMFLFSDDHSRSKGLYLGHP